MWVLIYHHAKCTMLALYHHKYSWGNSHMELYCPAILIYASVALWLMIPDEHWPASGPEDGTKSYSCWAQQQEQNSYQLILLEHCQSSPILQDYDTCIMMSRLWSVNGTAHPPLDGNNARRHSIHCCYTHKSICVPFLEHFSSNWWCGGTQSLTWKLHLKASVDSTSPYLTLQDLATHSILYWYILIITLSPWSNILY
jgi:hypothetical protein